MMGTIYAKICEFALKKVEKLEESECSGNEHLYTFSPVRLTPKVCSVESSRDVKKKILDGNCGLHLRHRRVDVEIEALATL